MPLGHASLEGYDNTTQTWSSGTGCLTDLCFYDPSALLHMSSGICSSSFYDYGWLPSIPEFVEYSAPSFVCPSSVRVCCKHFRPLLVFESCICVDCCSSSLDVSLECVCECCVNVSRSKVAPESCPEARLCLSPLCVCFDICQSLSYTIQQHNYTTPHCSVIDNDPFLQLTCMFDHIFWSLYSRKGLIYDVAVGTPRLSASSQLVRNNVSVPEQGTCIGCAEGLVPQTRKLDSFNYIFSTVVPATAFSDVFSRSCPSLRWLFCCILHSVSFFLPISWACVPVVL